MASVFVIESGYKKAAVEPESLVRGVFSTRKEAASALRCVRKGNGYTLGDPETEDFLYVEGNVWATVTEYQLGEYKNYEYGMDRPIFEQAKSPSVWLKEVHQLATQQRLAIPRPPVKR